MKAEIEIECSNPDMIIKSIEPDIDESNKFNIKLEPKENKIEMEVESEDISGLLAGINGYLRSIKTSINIQK